MLCLLLYRQGQVNEDGDYDRKTHFCKWFMQAIYGGVLDPKLTFFTAEAWVHLSWPMLMFRTLGTGVVLI
jgi:hypothetical protein